MVPTARLAALVVVASLVSASGCTRADPQQADASALQTVTTPELSGAEAGLQERVRAGYASLVALREQEGVASADLAAAYSKVGKLLLGADFLAESEPYFANAQTLDPTQFAWPYYLAHVHRLRNEPDRAIAAFEQALVLQPDNVPALVWLGATYMDAGRAGDAEPILQKAVSLAPKSIAARFWLGRAALAAGDYQSAVEHFDAALQADPQARPVHYPLALAHRALGNEARASEHLGKWKEGRVTPDDPLMDEIGGLLQTAVGYEVRGTRALEGGDWREAVAMFRKGLEVAPRDPTLHQNLGAALFIGGDAPGALAAFQEALRLSPEYARAHFSVGVLMDASGRDADAIQRFTDAIKYDPGLVTARFSLAEALRRTGELEVALAHYEQIVKADPAASQARFGAAMAQVRLRRWSGARITLEEAVAAHPEQPGLLHALARVLAAAPDDGVRDGARAWTIVQALEKQYGATLALTETAAMALAEVGRFSDAAARQRDALSAATQEGRAYLVPTLRANLKLYESRMPCRTPWADDDPVHRPRTSGLAGP